jgi:hypothetical protein
LHLNFNRSYPLSAAGEEYSRFIIFPNFILKSFFLGGSVIVLNK